MGDRITRAVYKAIAEKVIEQLEWDSTIEKYVLPEGFIFSIDAPIARIAAKDLGLTLPPAPNKVDDDDISRVVKSKVQEHTTEMTEILLKVISGAEQVLNDKDKLIK